MSRFFTDRRIPLALIFRATASEFLLSDDNLRRNNGKVAEEARAALIHVAKNVTPASDLTIGQVLARGGDYVRTRAHAALIRAATDGAWARRLLMLEAEVFAEAGVAGVMIRPLVEDAPEKIATRCIGPSRDAMSLSETELRILGAAYLALREDIGLRETKRDPRIVAAALAFAEAERAVRQNRHAIGERAASERRQAALDALVDITRPEPKEIARAS